MPAAGGKFLGILEAFLYQKHIPERILDAFSRKNAPEILKISRLRRAFYKETFPFLCFPGFFP